nr:DnaJ domain-containing protein [Halomarina oriensis]
MAYGPTETDADTRHDDRRVTAEDWHRGGFEYRPGDPSPSDDEWDDWEWQGAFWREDAADDRTGATDWTTGGGWTGGDWTDADEEPNWWGGWAEETGDTGRGRGRTGRRPGATDGRTSGRRGDRTTGRRQRQRQVSRPREEAATVLGVALDAPPETVREAFRRRAKETHPDCGGDEESFRRVRWAYEQLRE